MEEDGSERGLAGWPPEAGVAGCRSASVSGPASAQSSVPVQGATDAITEADVPFIVMIAAAAPTGVYTVTITATDGDGNTSDALTTQVTVQ